MLLGAYTYAILTVPVSAKDTVYYLYGGSAVNFSLPDLFGGVDTPAGLSLGVLLAILLGGCVAALFAYLIGLPVLRLKSDYLAIATLGFAEIIRAIFQWQPLGPVTNGANMITQIPTFNNFNITDANGTVILRLSTFFPFLIAIICIVVIVMLINSSYGRAFKGHPGGRDRRRGHGHQPGQAQDALLLHQLLLCRGGGRPVRHVREQRPGQGVHLHHDL